MLLSDDVCSFLKPPLEGQLYEQLDEIQLYNVPPSCFTMEFKPICLLEASKFKNLELLINIYVKIRIYTTC